jgi:long-chain acyl-CoA synthetase
MLSHRGLTLNPLQAQPIFQFSPEDVFLHAAPMFHLADGFFCMAAATFGVRNVFLPAFNPVQVLETIQSERITQALLVPTMVNMVVHHPDIGRYDLSSLQRVLYGASPMPEAVIRRAMDVIPNATFVQAYGQTEASPVLTLLGPEYHTTEGPYAGKLASAGCAVPGVDLAILDAEGCEVPRRRIGEICARGDNVMLGYWKLPEITAETLRGGWLHTGDGGYMDEEGFVFIVDRVKDMIISGGENVYSAEVENAIYQHEAVAECAVIGIPHETWGEQVHAVVRCKEEKTLSEEELITHCRRLIAAFKCPRSVEFVTAPLPLSGAGKILKRELRKPYWEGQERNVH